MPRIAITIPGRSTQPYRFNLDRKKVTIGRSPGNDIVIDCPSVSGTHCTMERVEGGYILRDLDSTNGLKLDDDKMSVIDLRNGIDVRVGDTEFEYSLSVEELDDLDEEDFIPHARKAEASGAGRPDEEEEDAPPSPKRKKAKVVPAPPRQPVTTPPLPSANTGGGFLVFATVICGILAFYAGLDHSYSGGQRKSGREGDISLFQDIKDGRPPLPEKEQEN